MSLESKLRERVQEMLIDEVSSLEEASVTANVPGYQTPYAFSKKKKGHKDPEVAGYKKVNEGKYHQYRNDETLTAKQKIGRSMREVRDGLANLEKLVKMNVRLKNELNVDSRSYWKNTNKALHKISERLVKLANKVGQLQ
tara:strand:+ start:1989 stop:2408 length:420 start_codon:yes stop_codon:yes gene_type:complete